MRSVAITGLGAVSSLGHGARALAKVLSEPADGIGRISHFDTSGFGTDLGGIVPDRDGEEEPAMRFAREAAAEAIAQAKIDVSAQRIALVLGSSLGTGHEKMYELTDLVAEAIGARGPRLTISTACSSSSNAIGLARDLVLAGVCDAAIAGGTDVLSPELFAGFHALGVLGKSPCAPFSFPEGTTLGEGAGFVVLERVRDAADRALAFVSGYGLSCDAHHPTTPDPSGMGVARAIRAALVDAGIDPSAIGYVNAHGTGTSANDPAETVGIESVLARDVPVSASKSFLGHAQGAAGVLEIIVTVLGLRAQKLPPTIHATELRRSAPKDIVPTPRAHAYDVALSLNSAFAGANSAVVLSRAAISAPSRDACKVHILGSAAFAGAPSTPIQRDIPMADSRGMDPSTRFLATACARALANAGLKPKGAERDRAGLVAAVSGYSAESAAEFRRSIRERGLPKVNASAFAKMVLNAPAGVAATLLSLRGATTTLTTGRGGGAIAVAYAAELLSHGGNDVLLAAAVDERTSEDGAGALVMGISSGPLLAGWAIGQAGANMLPMALDRAGLASVDATFSDEGVPHLSSGSIMACVKALEEVRAGKTAAVVSCGGGASVALVFR
jgi:3-oxoacyl-[acyl-carrier-protein] synthase II